MSGAAVSSLDQEWYSKLPNTTKWYFALFRRLFPSYLIVAIAMVGKARFPLLSCWYWSSVCKESLQKASAWALDHRRERDRRASWVPQLQDQRQDRVKVKRRTTGTLVHQYTEGSIPKEIRRRKYKSDEKNFWHIIKRCCIPVFWDRKSYCRLCRPRIYTRRGYPIHDWEFDRL